jgi:DNA polymerase-1
MRVALIDADILVYEAAYRSQEAIEWDEGEVTKYADLPEGKRILTEAIEAIVGHVDGSAAILALTHSDRDANFRRSVWSSYKDHREKDGDGRPLLYKALREWLRQNYDVHEKVGIEGDDTIGIMATMPQAWEPVIVSIDKDLDTVPGWHYNWRKRSELGVYYVNEDEAFRNFIFQTLTGDSTDNYPGIPGVGPVTAGRLMNLWSELPPWAVWEEVVATYEERGLTAEDALIQARCAYILQAPQWDAENQKAILWTPPREEDWHEPSE